MSLDVAQCFDDAATRVVAAAGYAATRSSLEKRLGLTSAGDDDLAGERFRCLLDHFLVAKPELLEHSIAASVQRAQRGLYEALASPKDERVHLRCMLTRVEFRVDRNQHYASTMSPMEKIERGAFFSGHVIAWQNTLMVLPGARFHPERVREDFRLVVSGLRPEHSYEDIFDGVLRTRARADRYPKIDPKYVYTTAGVLAVDIDSATWR